MKQRGTIEGYTKVIWNGITTIELARGIDMVIKEGIKGLYQLAPKKPIDKYSLLCLFKEVFGKEDVNIIENDKIISNKSLVNTRKDFAFFIKSYTEQIIDMKSWVDNHKQLYKHYFV